MYLPIFKGYTVDVRLKEFRKAVWGEMIEFIDFDSDEGEALWHEIEEYQERTDYSFSFDSADPDTELGKKRAEAHTRALQGEAVTA